MSPASEPVVGRVDGPGVAGGNPGGLVVAGAPGTGGTPAGSVVVTPAGSVVVGVPGRVVGAPGSVVVAPGTVVGVPVGTGTTGLAEHVAVSGGYVTLAVAVAEPNV